LGILYFLFVFVGVSERLAGAGEAFCGLENEPFCCLEGTFPLPALIGAPCDREDGLFAGAVVSYLLGGLFGKLPDDTRLGYELD
jgi:hypothetical protein